VSSAYTEATSEWIYMVQDFAMMGSGLGYGTLTMSLYSPDTGFLGETTMSGLVYGGGLTFHLGDTPGWKELPADLPFSPRQLHGAAGNLTIPQAGGIGLAGGTIYASAKTPKLGHLFTEVLVGGWRQTSGLGAGIATGVVHGRWKISSVWSSEKPTRP
jgi:hypothetical protein